MESTKKACRNRSSVVEELREEFGRALTPTDLAEIISVSPNTIRRYYKNYGGIEVAPGKFRFFENCIRKMIHGEANADKDYANEWKEKVACSRNGKWPKKVKSIRPNPRGETKSNRVGKHDARSASKAVRDPHGIT